MNKSPARPASAVNSPRDSQNVYAFIDSQNLNVGVQKFGWKMDWQKFRRWLAEEHGVSKAFMFIGYVPEFEAMYEQLHEAGYMIVLKPTYDMTRPQPDAAAAEAKASQRAKDAQNAHNGQGAASGEPGKKPEAEEKKPVKGNIDADLVLWAMKELPNYDKAILVSGDGDFYSLVEYLEEQDKLGKILTPSFQYSQLYNRFEDSIVRLDNYKRDLRYYDRRKK